MSRTTSPVRLVTQREVTERVRAKSFIISTVIYGVVALAAVIVPHLAGDQKTVYGVGLAGPNLFNLEKAIGQLSPVLDVDVRVRGYPDAEAAAKAVREKHVDAAVVGDRLLTRDEVPERLNILLNTAVFQANLTERLNSAGVPPPDLNRLLNPQPLQVDQVEAPQPLRTSNRPLAFAGVVVIYLVVLTYGITVATGVLEEKSSRVSEVLLGALRPSQLLGGKVVGIGLVAVVQILVIGIPTAAVALVLGSFDIPSGTPLTIAAVLMWAVLGYALYSCVFAAAGAAASRPEDVSNATAPITIMIALTYFVAIATTQEPDGTFARVASFIPPMAPMTMLPRTAVGHVAWWEVPLSVGLVLLFTYGSVRLGARLYRVGIGRLGPRLKLREAWRAAAS